jgi:hypothetical protein
MNIIERAKKIQKIMMNTGFGLAAEQFIGRVMSEYSTREFERIERAWLNYVKYRPI